MKLPQYDWVQFSKSPLRLIICQVRFTIIPRFEQKAFIASFQEAIRSTYPKVAREAAVTYELSSGGVQPAAGEKLWRFSSRDLHWSIVVGESALTLESFGQASMHDFLDRFRVLLAAAKEQLGVTDRLRLGLRYMHEVRFPGADNLTAWRTLLHPDFVHFDPSELLAGQVDHTLQEIQVNRPNGVLAVRHGLLNGAAVTPLAPEEPPTGPFYLIDLDYYDATESQLDIPATIQQLQTYHDVMYRFFRWTLSEKLYDYLEPGYA